MKKDDDTRFPHVQIKLTDPLALLNKIHLELKRLRVPPVEIGQFMTEATSGDYDNLLRACRKWVTIK